MVSSQHTCACSAILACVDRTFSEQFPLREDPLSLSFDFRSSLWNNKHCVLVDNKADISSIRLEDVVFCVFSVDGILSRIFDVHDMWICVQEEMEEGESGEGA